MNDPLESEDKSENPIAESIQQQEKEAAEEVRKKTPFSFPAMGQGQMDEDSEKKWASMGHLLSLIGIFTAGLGYLIGPLVIFFMKKGESPFVDEHAKETLNFSILTTIAIVIAAALAGGTTLSIPGLGCFGWLLPVFFGVANLIYCIQGFIAARNGEAYRYPFNFRIVK